MEDRVLKIGKCAIVAMAVMAALTPLRAQANSAAYCHRYARKAVIQVHAALAHPKCTPGLQGIRWSPDYRVHYRWCRGVSLAAALTARDARIAYLRECTR